LSSFRLPKRFDDFKHDRNLHIASQGEKDDRNYPQTVSFLPNKTASKWLVRQIAHRVRRPLDAQELRKTMIID